MSEAVENLNAVHEAHKREITQLHSTANQQCELVTRLLGLFTPPNALLLLLSLSLSLIVAKREVETLQRTIQERNGEIQQLQKQLGDLERHKHTEVVKLRLEVHVPVEYSQLT